MLQEVPREAVFGVTPFCACCHKALTRIIAKDTEWNMSGAYLLQCLNTGKVSVIENISQYVPLPKPEIEA